MLSRCHALFCAGFIRAGFIRYRRIAYFRGSVTVLANRGLKWPRFS